MNKQEIRKASEELLAHERSRANVVHETTPRNLDEALIAFGKDLVGSPPEYIPVINDPLGLYGWCSNGVVQKVEVAGGRPVFGWSIWEWPAVMWTAEYHCVWQNTVGDLVDITPKPHGEIRILFAADFSVPVDFDFDGRPTNRRKRIRQDRDIAATVSALSASLRPTQRMYEEKRAAKAGVSLAEWLLRKLPADPLPQLIDQAIQACSDHEAYADAVHPGGGTFVADSKLLRLMAARQNALEALRLALRHEGLAMKAQK